MIARNPDEPHRTASTLELLFDLVFVVAVSQASGALHHFWAEAHFSHGLLGYAMVFFAIWWAWMNFTWFASAYDTDDWLYRVMTVVQMGGALTVAAGAESAMVNHDFRVIAAGYVIMRIALAAQWLRAAISDVERRGTCLRYAVGIVVVQVLWVVWITALHGVGWLFPVLAALDMAVPVFAESFRRTTFHPVHVAERYGLFTLIVLGESILASANSIIGGLEEPGARGRLIVVSAAALVIVAAIWWIYFDRPQHDQMTTLRRTLFWGYAHYFIFAAAAAFSAGIEVAVDVALGHSHLSTTAAGLTVTVPLAVFVAVSWLVLLVPRRDRVLNVAMPTLAAVLVLTAWTPVPLPAAAALMVIAAALVSVRHGLAAVYSGERRSSSGSPVRGRSTGRSSVT